MATKAKLIIGRDKFSSLLAKRIADGKNLLAKDVPSERQSQDSYYGYTVRSSMQPVEFTDTQNTFISEFHKWTDYNSEMLKQYFDIPNNEYQTKYVKCGQALVISANEDIIELYKEELRDKIN